MQDAGHLLLITVVLVTFSSETGEASNRYPGVRITPFVDLKRSFLDVLGVTML